MRGFGVIRAAGDAGRYAASPIQKVDVFMNSRNFGIPVLIGVIATPICFLLAAFFSGGAYRLSDDSVLTLWNASRFAV